MKKIIRLTESDLTRIVRRVINEQNEINVGNTISGEANSGGNRPIEVEFKITKQVPNGYDGILTKWGFTSNYGVKVGDKINITNVKKGSDGNMSCTIIVPKMGNINLKYCSIV